MDSQILTPIEAATLSALAKRGEASQLELPRLASLTPNQMRKAVAGLIAKHLLKESLTSLGTASASTDETSVASFTPTRSGIEVARQLRTRSGRILVREGQEEPIDEESLDSALESAIADL